MNVHFERATVLLKQHRREQAKAELGQALSEDPNHAPAHALLAICLSDDDRHAEAAREAEAAIALEPEMAFAHYAAACVAARRHRLDEAAGAAQTAIRLNPLDADYYALLASICLQQRDWAGALAAADQGLSHDGQHVNCVNLRAAALTRLGRKDEAEAAIVGVLQRDPEDAGSHATMGWTLLQRHRPHEALECFRESLRLDPSSDFARAGMVEALKARYRIYGLMLRYFLWISSLSGKAQWGVILGGYVGMRLLRGVEEAHPAVAAWTWPIGIVYVIFVLLTWLADPLFNLLLRLNKFGRFALSGEQRVASNWVGGCLGLAIALVCAGFLLGSVGLVLLALVAGCTALPMSAVFRCATGWPRRGMAAYTALVALVGVVGAINLAVNPDAGTKSLELFVLGIFASGFVANGLMMVQPKL